MSNDARLPPPPSPSFSEQDEDGFLVFSPPTRTTASSSSLPSRRIIGEPTTTKKFPSKRRATLSGAIPGTTQSEKTGTAVALRGVEPPLRIPGPSRESVVFTVLTLSYVFPKRRRLIIGMSFLYFGLKWLAVQTANSQRVQASVFHAWPWITSWPPCDFSQPMQTQPFRYGFGWLDKFLPESFRSFRGIGLRTSPLRVLKRRLSNGLSTLGAWHVSPAVEKHRDDENNPSVVLYIHGRGGHRGSRNRVELYEHLGKAVGVHVVSFDPRGSGDSYFARESSPPNPATNESTKSSSFLTRFKQWWSFVSEEGNLPTERRLLEDAHAVWQTVVTPKSHGGLGFEWSKVMLWGQGTGACAAANLCLHLVRRGTPPAGMVLETPFTSASDLLLSRLKPYFDVKATDPILKEWISRMISSNRMELETRLIEIYARSAVPLLILSAEKDAIVPTSHGERLAAVGAALSASQQRVVFQMFPNASHDGIVRHPRFVPVVTSFLSSVLLRERTGKQRRGSSFVDVLG